MEIKKHLELFLCLGKKEIYLIRVVGATEKKTFRLKVEAWAC